MNDVIEACADGGFDIPATSMATRPAMLARYPSKNLERDDVSEKPTSRRVAIQLADDDDGGDSSDYVDCINNVDDGEREDNLHPGTTPKATSSGRTLQELTEDRRTVDDESSDVDVGEDSTAAAAAAVVEPPAAAATAAAAAACDGGGGIDDTPELYRPEYRIYKIETPEDDEDPSRLEIVVALSSEEDGATAAAVPASGSAARLPANPRPRPSARVLPDGRSIVVDPHRSSQRGALVGRLLSLTLPQRVVPESARSFFWEGDLTIRAVLAAE